MSSEQNSKASAPDERAVMILVLRRYLMERRRSLRTELVEIERTLQEIGQPSFSAPIQEER